MDFGTASLVDGPALTATGEVIGTIAYMAPEQAEGARVGPPADVYALGLTLYECLSGDNPFSRATPAATARAIGAPVAPLGDSRPELPPDLCALIDACLAPQPAERPSLHELGDGLARAAPRLSPDQPVPTPRRRERGGWSPSPRAAPMARIATLAAVTAFAAWLGLVAGRPGTALVVVALLLPLPLLLPGPTQWGIPALAPLLAGLVALHGALAGDAPDPAAGPLAAALVAIVLGALWARTTRFARPAPGVGRSPPLS